MMSLLMLAASTFWATIIFGAVVTPCMLRYLKRVRLYNRYQQDRKKTIYGTQATEFNALREREEKEGVKKGPVVRAGGLLFLPTIVVVGGFLAYYLSSAILTITILGIVLVSLVTLYDDLTDMGVLRRRRVTIVKRLTLLGFVALGIGTALQVAVPNTVTFLPISLVTTVEVGWLLPFLFAGWFIFWQLSSVIDGIDGLSGSIFLILFISTSIVSLVQSNTEALVLSTLALGAVISWLFVNHAPARAYLTEVGITIFIFLFATVTFLLGVGEAGNGLWLAVIFGLVLIATWVSNVLQLVYRRYTGKQLFRIAPIHHHFEAIGIPGSAVVSWYVLATILCVIIGLSLLLLFS